MKFNFKGKNWKEYALAGCTCILFFVIVYNIGKILGAFGSVIGAAGSVFLGMIIAYINNPLAVFFDKKLFGGMKNRKRSWIISVIAAIGLVVLLIGLLLAVLIPEVLKSISIFGQVVPEYVEGLEEKLEAVNSTLISPEAIEKLFSFAEGEGALNSGLDYLAQNTDLVIQKVKDFTSGTVKWVIGAVFAIYFLILKEEIAEVISNFLSLTVSSLNLERMHIVLEKFNSIFSKFIVSEIIDALIIGGLCFVFMLVTRMPQAVLISVEVGITNLVPTFGPIVGAAIAAFILLVTKPAAIIPLLLFIALIQLADGYIIKPKLMGNVLDVPGVLIIAATVTFGNLMGVTGMLLAIPFAAIITYLYAKVLIPWLELQKDLKEYRRDMSLLAQERKKKEAEANAREAEKE